MLDERANRLARCLLELGCERGDRVCLFLPKSPAAIVAMVGALRAGCAYVPVDLDSPGPRLAKIVARAEPRVVIVAQEAAERLEEVRAAGGLDEGVRIGSLHSEAGDLAFDANTARRLSGRSRLAGSRPRRSRAHPLHVRLHGRAEGRRDHPRQRACLSRLGRAAFRDRRGRSSLRPPSAPFRSVHVRHLRRSDDRGGAPPGAAGAQPAAEGDRALHRAARADAVVLGSVRPDLHGEVRRRPRRRLPDASPGALVRRRAADARAGALARTATARSLHESVRPHGGDDREQLPRDRRPLARRHASDPDRQGLPRRGAARPRRGSEADGARRRRRPLSGRCGSEPRATGATRSEPGWRSSRIHGRSARTLGSTRRAIARASTRTGSCTSSAGPTRR